MEAGIGLAFGANIGTCVTALLASIGKATEALQAAAVHVLFNVLGVTMWFAFIDDLAELSRMLSRSYPGLKGFERLAAETPRQVANAHTLFNVLNAFIFIGFSTPLAKLVKWLIPIKVEKELGILRPKYLDLELMKMPVLAVERVRLETARMGYLVVKMFKEFESAVMRGTHEVFVKIEQSDQNVNRLYTAIVEYIRMLSLESLSRAESIELSKFLTIAGYIENAGDAVKGNLVDLGRKGIERNLEISAHTQEKLPPLFKDICDALECTIRAIEESDEELSQSVISRKLDIHQLTGEILGHLNQRLQADAPDRMLHFQLESDIVEQLKRCIILPRELLKRIQVKL